MNFEIAPKSTEIKTNWNDAKLYCFSLNVDGKSGWRLPTKKELNEIYHSENDFNLQIYWSSNETNYYSAWCQGFTTGNQYHDPKNLDTFYWARAVRDLV